MTGAPTAANGPSDVPPRLWSWIVDRLGEGAQRIQSDPATLAVLAAGPRRLERSGPVPDEVLREWSWLVDDKHRVANQSERAFIEAARGAEWADGDICRALCVDPATDLDERIAALNALVRRPIRPPAP